MSVFDALGAAATILQFIEYGIKFGNKVVVAYKGRSELAELRQLIRDYQQKNESLQGKFASTLVQSELWRSHSS